MKYEKVYVETVVRFTRDGKLLPERIVWEDGNEYEVDKVLKIVSAPPPHVGSYLSVRYDVRMQGQLKELYFEPQSMQWFVEKRQLDNNSVNY